MCTAGETALGTELATMSKPFVLLAVALVGSAAAAPRVLQGFPNAPPGTLAPNPVQPEQRVCEGDTRGDRRCAHDPTHRVCARIGDADTSFWQFTRQNSWCGTRGRYTGLHGSDVRCPPEEPTWCICKWATADWIQGETCNDRINIDCEATDICATELGLFFSYNDYDVNLRPAHECVSQKCPEQWRRCAAANPGWGAQGGGH